MTSQHAPRRNLPRQVGSIIVLLVIAWLFLPARVRADTIMVRKSQVEANFPKNITFLLNAESSADIDQVRLIYGVTTETCYDSQARHEMEFQPASSVELKWEWDLFRSGSVPPGVEIWWQWEIHSADGSSLTIEVQKQTIEDKSFHWKKLESGAISLYWASGNDAFGRSLLNTAVQSADRLSKTAGLSSNTAIQLFIYPTTEDLKGVLAHTTEWMGGVAFPEYKIILIGIPVTRLDWAKQVIPHELSHLQLEMRTFNCLSGQTPSWLNEGMAEFAEGPVPENERREVLEMLEKDSLQSLVSIADGFPADPDRANLAYMQSRQVITFLIETYGQEDLQALLDQLQSGENIDPALRSVYGLDTNGIDQAWRASLGFGTAPEPSFATATPVKKSTAAPTMSLMQPFVQPTETSTQSPPPVSTPTRTETALAVQAGVTGTDVPAPIGAPTLVEPARTNAGPNTMLWVLLGGGLILLLLVSLFWYHRSARSANR